jgi:hypothetical protein
MGKFLIKLFFKNPVGLIVLGILVSVGLGPASYADGENPLLIIVGIIISVIGILWLINRRKREQSIIAAQIPLYLAIVDALKKCGYEVTEFEHKSNLLRSRVKLNGGDSLGEVFIVPPPPNGQYTLFKELVEKVQKEFEYDYVKKTGKSPDISAFWWPNESLVGAYIQVPMKDYSEAKWLPALADTFQEALEKSSGK